MPGHHRAGAAVAGSVAGGAGTGHAADLCTKADIYRDVSLHGPDLQGLHGVGGRSTGHPGSGSGPAPSPTGMGLRQPLRGTWLADPLVLDSAFQAMIVWSFENHGWRLAALRTPASTGSTSGRFRATVSASVPR